MRVRVEKTTLHIFTALLFLFLQTPVVGFTAIATDSCPAWNDLKQSRNRDALSLQKGRRYEIVQTHKGKYLVRIPGTPPQQRWVDPQCFSPKYSATQKRHLSSNTTKMDALLVLSWHNSFCENHPHRKECRPLFSGYADNRLVLHGLWPQPSSRIYCNIPRSLIEKDRKGLWRALPTPPLPQTLRRALLQRMPGALSGLDRHEWIKHGSCYDPDPVRYFGDALSLTDEVDRSMLGEYLRANVGGRITLAAVRKVFEKSFGKGYGNRLIMRCRGRVLSEIRISLHGKGDKLRPLLSGAKRLYGGCRDAIVDAPGPFRRQ